MKKMYEAPALEQMEILVEQGFAGSGGVESMSIGSSTSGDDWGAGEEI